jgi:hypothetical protein
LTRYSLQWDARHRRWCWRPVRGCFRMGCMVILVLFGILWGFGFLINLIMGV